MGDAEGVAVIPKSNNQGRLKQNLEVGGGWDLGKEEIEKIGGLDRGLRFNDPLHVSTTLSLPLTICGGVCGVLWFATSDESIS